MKSFRNSIIIATLSLAFIAPHIATAWVDPSALAQRVIMIAQNVRSLVLGNAAYLKEYMLDVAQKGIATRMEQVILDSTLTWARNGFNGQPSFVVNPRDFVENSLYNEGELFIDQLNQNIASICSPYRIDVSRVVSRSQVSRGERARHDAGELIRLTQCDLDQFVTNGVIENYYAPGGFELEGGFAPILRTTMSRKNNPYEAPEVAKELMLARQQKAVAEAQSEVSNGTLPKKDCVIPGPNGTCAYSITRTPAGNVSDLVSKAVGHSLDEISGQDEILESIFAGVVRQFTDRVISAGGGIR